MPSLSAPEYCLDQYRLDERHAHVVACHRDSRGSPVCLAGILARCRHVANVVPAQLGAGAAERRHCVPGPALVVTLSRPYRSPPLIARLCTRAPMPTPRRLVRSWATARDGCAVPDFAHILRGHLVWYAEIGWSVALTSA